MQLETNLKLPERVRGALANTGLARLIGGNDELRVGVTAHAIDGARGAGSDGVCVATRVFCSDGDRTVGTTDD